MTEKCDTINCDEDGVIRKDGFIFCYKCYVEYKALNDGDDTYE